MLLSITPESTRVGQGRSALTCWSGIAGNPRPQGLGSTGNVLGIPWALSSLRWRPRAGPKEHCLCSGEVWGAEQGNPSLSPSCCEPWTQHPLPWLSCRVQMGTQGRGTGL